MEEVVVGGSGPGNVVCDLDGVVYRHHEAVPGAGGALLRLEEMGFRVLFVTNNSTTPAEQVAARIRQAAEGYGAEPSQVLTSAQAAALLLAGDRPGTLVVGSEGIFAALDAAGVPTVGEWSLAEAVVVGLDWDLDYGRLREAALALRAGARFVATNTDPTFPAGDELWPGAGAIVAALEVASGRRPEVAGKPHQAIRRLVAERLGPGPTWVVGDRPSTDLAMARAEGWGAVLVLSGVTAPGEDIPEEYRPDLVVASLAELPEVLAAASQ